MREVMCVLDLDYVCLPCPAEHVVHAPTPKEGRWKMEAQAKGGRADLPLLIDPNTDAVLHADEIVPYLWETYGPLQGEIDVTVVEAKNLTNRPKPRGLSLVMGCSRQAYAEVVLQGCPVPPLRTDVKPYTLEPRFDETFSYGFTSDHQALHITIRDKDGGLADDSRTNADAFMGRVVVPLSEVISGMLLKKKLADLRDGGEPLGCASLCVCMCVWYVLC